MLRAVLALLAACLLVLVMLTTALLAVAHL